MDIDHNSTGREALTCGEQEITLSLLFGAHEGKTCDGQLLFASSKFWLLRFISSSFVKYGGGRRRFGPHCPVDHVLPGSEGGFG